MGSVCSSKDNMDSATMQAKKAAKIEKRIVMTGPEGSGKTTLVLQYIKGFLTPVQPTTHEETHVREHQVTIGKTATTLSMQLFDTPSDLIKQNHAADVVLIVYSAGGPNSCTDEVYQIYETAKEQFGSMAVYYLV